MPAKLFTHVVPAMIAVCLAALAVAVSPAAPTATPAATPSATPAAARAPSDDDARLDRAMETYLHAGYNFSLRPEALAILRAGGARSLEAWHRRFAMSEYVHLDGFNAQVLAYLPEAEINAYLLKEFRRCQPDMRKYSQLIARHAPNNPWTEADEAEAARLAPVERWWDWVIRASPPARPALGFVTSYDEAYALLVDPDFASTSWVSSRAMVRIDAARAAADFAKLVRNPDPAMQVRGLAGYAAMERLPEADAWREIVRGSDALPKYTLENATYFARRDQVDLVTPLVANPDVRISRQAVSRLKQLSWMTQRQVDELAGGSAKPEDRERAWQKWWDEHKAATDADLREAGLKALIVDVEGGAKWDSIYHDMERFLDRPELVPALVKRLSSENSGMMRTSVASMIGRMEGKAQPAAIDALLAYCRKAPPSEAVYQAYYLGQSKDPRAVDLLLKLMETEPDAIKCYAGMSGPGPKTLGRDADKRAAEIYYRMIVEKHDRAAANYFSAIPGAEAYLPQLLEAWQKEPDEKNRSVLHEAVARLGDSRMGPELARLLAATKPGSPLEAEILDLMTQFPDAAAKPLLAERLKVGHVKEHAQVAKVLATMGDFSGADALVEDLKQGRPEDFPGWSGGVGDVLRQIGAPDARPHLLALYEKSAAKDRGRVIEALAALHDTANLEFFERLLGDADKRVAKAAFRGMVEAIDYAPSPRFHFGGRSMPEEFHDLVRALLLYERFDEPLRPTDGKFRHDSSFKPWDEAFIAVGFTEYFRFSAKDRVLKVVKTEPYSGHISLSQISPRMDEDVARLGRPVTKGLVFWHRYDKYLLLDVRVGQDQERVDYVFKFDGRRWNPLCGSAGE